MKFSSRSVPFALLALGLLAYGLYSPWMGFYWDDWPWMWISHTLGPEGLMTIDSAFRPLAGVLLWLGSLLTGDQPLGWQLLNFGFRVLSGISLWWAMGQIWPKHKAQAAWAAMLFMVYPGYSHQFVAVNTSRHMLPLAIFCLSLGVMALAVRRREKYWGLTVAAMLLSLVAMLTTDYYYGLELIRPIVLWQVLDFKDEKLSKRLAVAFKKWTPYLIPVAILFTRRYAVSQDVNYQMLLLEEFSANPGRTTINALLTILEDFYHAFPNALATLFSPPRPSTFGLAPSLAFGALVVGVFVVAMFYLWKLRNGEENGPSWGKKAMLVGAVGVAAGGLPPLLTGIHVSLEFPEDRLMLPMLLGVSLFHVGLLEAVVRGRGLKILLLSAVIGLGVGQQFQTAVSYRRDWIRTNEFFKQFSWRVPGMKESTLILTQQLPIQYSSDTSLIAPLNMIYAPEASGERLPYSLAYYKLRVGTRIPALQNGYAIQHSYDYMQFEGSTDEMLVIYSSPPACLQVLDPVYDLGYVQLPEATEEALPLSNPGQIIGDGSETAIWSAGLFELDSDDSWCYYFERADLARQRGDWGEVAASGDKAFASGGIYYNPGELLPFIEGYARMGNWERAEELSQEALKENANMQTILCATWERIVDETESRAVIKAGQVLMADTLACESP